MGLVVNVTGKSGILEVPVSVVNSAIPNAHSASAFIGVLPLAPIVTADDVNNSINYGSLTLAEKANLEYSANGGTTYSSTVPTI